MNDSASKSQIDAPITRIAPAKGWVSLGLSELWAYRELLFFMVWRDIKVRYKQTVLGAAWAILQPFFLMVVFNVIFGNIAQIASDGLPYPLFSFAALVPYQFFANSLTQGSNSLLASAGMIKKIYFPRLVVPIASVLAGVVDFTLSFSILIGMVLYFHFFTDDFSFVFSAKLLLLPLLLLLLLITSLGMSLWFSALNAQFRDVRYLVPFLSQALLFLSPIAYPISRFSRPVQLIAGFNPLTGVSEGFRWALLGTDTAPEAVILISYAAAIFIFIGGAFYFRRMEKTVADVM